MRVALAILGVVVLVSILLAALWAVTFMSTPPRVVPPPHHRMTLDQLEVLQLEEEAERLRARAFLAGVNEFQAAAFNTSAVDLEKRAAELRQKIRDTWT